MSMPAPTLVEALRGLPAAPDRGFTFVRTDGTRRFWSWAALGAEAVNRAKQLRARGVEKGDRVALVIPEGDEFVLTFLGACVAGAVPVPIYPQIGFKNVEVYRANVAHIAGAAGAKLLVTTATMRPYVAPAIEGVESLGEVVDARELSVPDAGALEVTVSPSDVAFLQFTSGSTALPRGVIVTHGALAANAKAFVIDGLAADPAADRGVSWLPLFHDMGLIGFVIGPIFGDIPVTFLPTASFVRNPRIWLDAIHDSRGTITYAPNFAYALIAKRLKAGDLAGLDLSCLRVAGCGAEPVQSRTLREFAAKLAPIGLDPRVFVPSYGMAEATLAISFAPRGRQLVTDIVTTRSLQAGKPQPAGADVPAADTQELVSCGHTFPGHELKIRGTEQGATLGEREVGEICVRGPSVCRGYWNEPAESARVFRGEWLHSGDLGYMAGGELYICGRIKDVIIVRGRNYYPQDIESVAGDVRGVRRGNVVAFGLSVDRDGRVVGEGTGEERLVICAEGTRSDAPRLEAEIAAAVSSRFALAVHQVRIVAPGTLPRTSSGKPQRRKTRERFLNGTLKTR